MFVASWNYRLSECSYSTLDTRAYITQQMNAPTKNSGITFDANFILTNTPKDFKHGSGLIWFFAIVFATILHGVFIYFVAIQIKNHQQKTTQTSGRQHHGFKVKIFKQTTPVPARKKPKSNPVQNAPTNNHTTAESTAAKKAKPAKKTAKNISHQDRPTRALRFHLSEPLKSLPKTEFNNSFTPNDQIIKGKKDKPGSLIANVFSPKLKQQIRNLRPKSTVKTAFAESTTTGTGDQVHRAGDSCFLERTIITDRGPEQKLYMAKCPRPKK